jgi:hypothetical protein
MRTIGRQLVAAWRLEECLFVTRACAVWRSLSLELRRSTSSIALSKKSVFTTIIMLSTLAR